ncbi:hypothetical protein [Manganibacter manganicus]|nr:hypothetical protein [Pseudaminobacter manganicus]
MFHAVAKMEEFGFNIIEISKPNPKAMDIAFTASRWKRLTNT